MGKVLCSALVLLPLAPKNPLDGCHSLHHSPHPRPVKYFDAKSNTSSSTVYVVDQRSRRPSAWGLGRNDGSTVFRSSERQIITRET
jgi:hypothetical protein